MSRIGLIQKQQYVTTKLFSAYGDRTDLQNWRYFRYEPDDFQMQSLALTTVKHIHICKGKSLKREILGNAGKCSSHNSL